MTFARDAEHLTQRSSTRPCTVTSCSRASRRRGRAPSGQPRADISLTWGPQGPLSSTEANKNPLFPSGSIGGHRRLRTTRRREGSADLGTSMCGMELKGSTFEPLTPDRVSPAGRTPDHPHTQSGDRSTTASPAPRRICRTRDDHLVLERADRPMQVCRDPPAAEDASAETLLRTSVKAAPRRRLGEGLPTSSGCATASQEGLTGYLSIPRNPWGDSSSAYNPIPESHERRPETSSQAARRLCREARAGR